jgi:hypothetical protein
MHKATARQARIPRLRDEFFSNGLPYITALTCLKISRADF